MRKYNTDQTPRHRKRKGRGGLQHVGIERRTVHGPEWKSLIPPAKIRYIHLKARFNGSNNGEIELPYSAMKDVKGCSSPATISKADIELKEKEWIEVTREGGLYRYKNLYKLTFKHDRYGYC